MNSSTKLRIATGSVCGVLFIALTIFVGLNSQWIHGLDSIIQSAVFATRSEAVTPFLEATTEWSGIGISHILMIAFFIFLLARKKVRKALIYFATFMVADTVFNLIKTFMDRPRPSGMNLMDFPLDSSYPSGHVFMACAFFCFVVFIIIQEHPGMPKPAKIVLIALAVLWPLYIGYTRVYVGVHWPTDVLGSLLFGGGTFLPFATLIWQKFANVPAKKKDDKTKKPKKTSIEEVKEG